MAARIDRMLFSAATAVLLICVFPNPGNGWSFSNPFSSEKKKATSTNVSRSVNKEPSMLDKMGSGTKKFFDRTSETLGLKKPETKKKSPYTVAVPKTPDVRPQKKESKSWTDSLFGSTEPKKKKTVNDWMKQKRLDP